MKTMCTLSLLLGVLSVEAGLDVNQIIEKEKCLLLGCDETTDPADTEPQTPVPMPPASAFVSGAPTGQDGPQVCVVVRTYSKQAAPLRSLLFGLLANDYRPLTVFVVDTEAKYETHASIQNVVNLISDERVMIPPLSGPPEPFSSFGYHHTDTTLEWIQRNAPTCEYMLFTNGDNFYSRHFLSEILPSMEAGIGMIGVHFISGHFWPERNGRNLLIETAWQHMRVDLGAAVVRLDLIGHTRFMRHGDSTRDLWDADWRFFEALLESPGTVATTAIVPQVLFMHM